MKRKLIQIAILGMTMMAFGAAIAQSKVVLTWTSGNTGSNALPACPATAPKSCVSGYRLSMDGNQLAAESNIGPTSTTYTQTPLPSPGSHAYSLIMVGFDALGAAISSTPATATVNVPAPVTIPVPAGFTVVLK